MLSIIKSCTLIGVEGFITQIETDITSGMPAFITVGLPDASVKEAKDRLSAALKNSGFVFPYKRVTINLAPGDIKKEGTHYDLPMALGILFSSGQLVVEADFSDTIVFGELSLNGEIRAVSGTLPIIIEAKRQGYRRVILPYDNGAEASVVDGIEVIAIKNLCELQQYLYGEKDCVYPSDSPVESTVCYTSDFADVKGQENIKRAMEIAAAGGHNMLMIGPPGSGKTMLARCFPSILPDMTQEESLESTKIYSIAGLLKPDKPLLKQRPFRAPHHTISAVSLTGGGRIPQPGEVSLAHLGVLFLDELPEFQKNALEALRQPIEDKLVTISRVNATITYPSSFMLLAGMNPCPCGHYGDDSNRCRCSEIQIRRYLNRISAPLLDRIDIHTEVPNISYEKLADKKAAESSETIRARVNAARQIQLNRYATLPILMNADLTPRMIETYCRLGEQEELLIKQAFTTLNLSGRAYHRILKLARTIADLDEKRNIEPAHLAEAIQYRRLER